MIAMHRVINIFLFYDAYYFSLTDAAPSPQSKSHTSEDCDNFRAKEETFLVKVGTPELVPKKVTFTYNNFFLSGLNLDL